MYYNHKYNGEKLPSIEAVPNLEFWKQLPSLVKDGCIYSHHHGKDIAMMVRSMMLWLAIDIVSCLLITLVCLRYRSCTHKQLENPITKLEWQMHQKRPRKRQ